MDIMLYGAKEFFHEVFRSQPCVRDDHSRACRILCAKAYD
jgi:hypothetical protein